MKINKMQTINHEKHKTKPKTQYLKAGNVKFISFIKMFL